MNTLMEVYNKWQNDPQFKKDFQKNPRKALKSRGMQLSPSDLHKIQSLIDPKQNENEELGKRISK